MFFFFLKFFLPKLVRFDPFLVGGGGGDNRIPETKSFYKSYGVLPVQGFLFTYSYKKLGKGIFSFIYHNMKPFVKSFFRIHPLLLEQIDWFIIDVIFFEIWWGR